MPPSSSARLSCRLHALRVGFLGAIASLLCSSPVGASPLFELVGDADSAGSLQARTLSESSAGAYYNPALLVFAPAQVTLGVLVLDQRIKIAADRRLGSEFDVPEGTENARTSEGERFDLYPAATSVLEHGRMETDRKPALAPRPRQGASAARDTFTYLVAGFVSKMWNDRVALAVHALLPTGEFTRMRAFFNDEREQYFSNSLHPELYADRMLALSLAAAIGLRVTDDLALGVGTTFALETRVNAGAYVIDTGNLGNILLSMDAPVQMGVSPHLGLAYQLHKRLRLTATAHTPQRIELGTGFNFLLPNLIEDASSLKFVLDYMPWRVGLGAAFDLLASANRSFTLVANLLYANWAAYRDRQGARPAGTYEWSDTFTPTVGARFRTTQLTAALDLVYAASPVPAQTGRTNYVDNDRIGASLGADHKFTPFGVPLSVGAQLQLHHLMSRHQKKLPTPASNTGNLASERVKDELPDDALLSGEPVTGAEGLQTNNPGWPGFGSTGWLISATAYLKLAL